MGQGLYANIHAKRKRGGKMRKKGAKGAPTAANFARAAQTAKKAVGGVIGKVKTKVTKPKPKHKGVRPPGLPPKKKRMKRGGKAK